MKTVFALFKDYARAKTAVVRVQQRGLTAETIQALAADSLVDNVPDIHRSSPQSIGETDSPVPSHLDNLLSREQAIPTPDAGRLYAGGELASLLASSATARGGLQEALLEFGVPRAIAEVYTTGVRQGGLLLVVRADDESATAAAGALREAQGIDVGSYPR